MPRSVSGGSTITDKTADWTVVQKNVIIFLNKEGQTPKVTVEAAVLSCIQAHERKDKWKENGVGKGAEATEGTTRLDRVVTVLLPTRDNVSGVSLELRTNRKPGVPESGGRLDMPKVFPNPKSSRYPLKSSRCTVNYWLLARPGGVNL